MLDHSQPYYYLGIDIGGTKCAVSAGTEAMDILARAQFTTDTDIGPHAMITTIVQAAADLIRRLPDRRLRAIGITCGGPLDSRQGLILSPPNLPGWDRIPITQIFSDAFGVPVFLQNDANACALAEWRFGAGKGTRHMIFLTFGTGLGAGLILNGQLYTGSNDLAGEVGHIRLSEEGPWAYGKQGSFEGFCSGAGIARLARQHVRELWDQGASTALARNEAERQALTAKGIADAALRGDSTALEIFRISGKHLGLGISILIDLLNPERIVIGSVFARNPQLFADILRETVRQEALEPAAAVCDIVPAALGDEVGDIASLSVALNGIRSQPSE